MEKYLEAQIDRIDKTDETQDKRLDNHGKEIDLIKLQLVAMEKDNSQLRESMDLLRRSVDTLIKELGKVKLRPLEKYEQIAMVVIVAVVGYLVGKWF